MNTNNINPDEARLSGLLREARATPSLPPRFRENVWRRIEDSELPTTQESWLDALAALILRPRLAFAFAAVLVLMGGMIGTKDGVQTARHDAEARYVASVAPGSLR
jgi:hypothetical protein